MADHLWILRQRDQQRAQYGSYTGFVVRANSAVEARQLAAQEASSEKPECWINTKTSTCVPLWDEGPSEIIMAEGNQE